MKKLSLIVILLCSACTVDHGNSIVVSNKIVDIKNLNLNGNPKTKKVKGEDLSHTIIFIPTKVPTISSALNSAFYNSDADLLTDANINYTFWYIPYIYEQEYWTITRTGVKTRHN